MKILYLSNNRFPTEKAHGLQMAKMCEAFLEAGAEVELVVPKRKQTSEVDTENARRFYSLKRDLKVKRIFSVDLLQSRIVPRIFAYSLQSASFALSFMAGRLKLNADIIYTRTILPLLFSNAKWIFEAHTFPKSLPGRFFQKAFLKNAAGIVCISKALAQKYKKIYKGKILVAEDGVDVALFSNLKNASKSSRLVILYTGSPYKWKGVFTLAEATRGLDADTVFLGGNKNEPEFIRLKKFAGHAKVIPYVHYSEVPGYIAKADILVIPNSAKDNISKEDSSPLKLFEYMASGKKIVASRVPAITSILTEKEAWFFEPDDSADLKKKIEDAMVATDKKGVLAAEKAREYSWAKRAKKIISFLNTL